MAGKNTLMVSVSGVRGIVGSSFTPEVIVRYTQSFAGLFPGKHVVLGRDSRVSGPWVLQLVEAVLMACGKRVTNIGIVATPTVQLAVKLLDASGGGMVVTSSHNPIEWNGLKFIAPDSLFLSPEQCAALYRLELPVFAERVGGVSESVTDWNERHVAAVLACEPVAAVLPRLRARKFKVALDTVHGAGGPVMRLLLEGLGCEVRAHLYPETSGMFPRAPEPIPEHLKELGEAVRESKSEVGIAVDPDVDRCVVLDEEGRCVGEEKTLVAAAEYMLGREGAEQGLVVRNLSSSRALDIVASRYGSRVEGVPVGEVHVARAMLLHQAVLGGEGNGGVLLPHLHLGRDAPVAAALILAFLLTSSHSSTSAAFAALPPSPIVKLKGPLPPHFDRCVDAIATRLLASAGPDASISRLDGVRIDTPEGWVHLRRSNTEPIFRVIGEYGASEQTSLLRCTAILDEVAALSAQFQAEEPNNKQ